MNTDSVLFLILLFWIASFILVIIFSQAYFEPLEIIYIPTKRKKRNGLLKKLNCLERRGRIVLLGFVPWALIVIAAIVFLLKIENNWKNYKTINLIIFLVNACIHTALLTIPLIAYSIKMRKSVSNMA